MSVEDLNARSWTTYGQSQLHRAHTPPVPHRLNWSPWEGVGPGAEILGRLAGRRVLDIGSGAGHHAVHLAQAHGAHMTAVELSATQHQRALHAHGGATGIEFVQGDVADHLRTATPYEAAYAIGTLAYLDPYRILPALRDGLRPGAPLILSLLHTDLHDRGPSTTVAPREQMILLRDDPPLPVQMWVLSGLLWEDLLTEHDFTVENIDLLRAPEADSPVVHQLITARRRKERPARRVSSRPRTSRAPTPHAALGVGVIVTNSQGEVLLGRHRHGTFELPGGSVEPGESLVEAAVRELREESGLDATASDVVLLGTLVDHVDNVVRITVAALVRTWSGAPADQPDECIDSWRWTSPQHLPDGLFVCSAQILAAWRPELLIDCAPASFTPYAHQDTFPAPGTGCATSLEDGQP